MILVIEILLSLLFLVACAIWYKLEGGFEPIVVAIGGLFPIVILIRSEFITRKTDKDLKFILGEWECNWSFQVPRTYDAFSDRVKITKLKRGKFEGVGFNDDLGEYEIFGEVLDRVVWFKFNGVAGKQDITGLVLLQRKAQRTILDGEWIQYYSAEKIGRGKVSLQKT
ncbi:hypothetical protein KUV89_04700 [Marinobacter hydrocarbonoclasticus]|nr:hypothetical protein [Marinobacter nauticus]